MCNLPAAIIVLIGQNSEVGMDSALKGNKDAWFVAERLCVAAGRKVDENFKQGKSPILLSAD